MEWSMSMMQEIVDFCRTNNLQHFRFGEIELTFGPTTRTHVPKVPLAPGELAPVTGFELPKCRCGHGRHDHRAEFGCMHGCAALQCLDAAALTLEEEKLKPF